MAAQTSLLRTAAIHLAIWLATFAITEIALRIADPRALREGQSERTIAYRHDAELGWVPVPNSAFTVTAERPIHARHNSLGLRDIEPGATGKPRILFVGDSYVWGNDVEAEERFTDLLRERLPNHDIVNAGVSGYGTDQEYLWLTRLWDRITPQVVVLMFTVVNDRWDNSSNVRYDGYFKPYFATAPDGALRLGGQPVPQPRQLYFKEDPLVHNLWIARAAVFAWIALAHPQIAVPDPTERLVGMMRDFVTAQGATFLVGMQITEPRMAAYLEAQNIPYAAFDGADVYRGLEFGFHWTPAGHALVAQRLMTLLARAGIKP
ncbi:MAG: SGNH/GDSL hydrolase family protein [Alphaproteobacteria bacterium]|nr:MAG: SGNH/GDSL hydrolase family protein [Alphaproteobacteria bacterium]